VNKKYNRRLRRRVKSVTNPVTLSQIPTRTMVICFVEKQTKSTRIINQISRVLIIVNRLFSYSFCVFLHIGISHPIRPRTVAQEVLAKQAWSIVRKTLSTYMQTVSDCSLTTASSVKEWLRGQLHTLYRCCHSLSFCVVIRRRSLEYRWTVSASPYTLGNFWFTFHLKYTNLSQVPYRHARLH